MFTDAPSAAEARCRAAASLDALAFTIVNETFQALPYRQAMVWVEGLGGPRLVAVSGLAGLPEDSPFTVWARRLVKALWPQVAGLPKAFDLARLEQPAPQGTAVPGLPPPGLFEGWREWWPAHLVIVPLVREGDRSGAAMFLFQDTPDAATLALLARLQDTWSHCAWAVGRRTGNRGRARAGRLRHLRWAAPAAALLAMAIPIRQSALAPAEIVALNAVAVAAPVDGVIKNFHVRPNQQVRSGQPLFSLDDTTLRNRHAVAAQTLAVAAAELRTAQQKAFDDNKARSDVATLQGRIAEKQAELAAVDAQLERVDVTAPREGIAVFGDVNDWQGRPVATGERVMQVADPLAAGVLVYLPVADAIELAEGAALRLFLNVAPLSPLDATLIETSYLSTLSPDGVASYRLRGRLVAGGDGLPRIGLKGTAKILGAQVPLGYYLFRRPLAALRQWSGL